MIKKLGILLMLATLLLTIAACGSSADTGENSAAADASSEQQETVAETPEQQDSSTEADDVEDPSDPVAEGVQSETADGGNDTLVVYFSRTGEQYTVGVIEEGNTAIVAKMIAERTGAELFELLPADDHYPMTYAELTDVAKQEQNENARPDYAGEVPDLSGYSTIFIGAPVWWGDWPMILYTFFEKNAEALSGKTLVPFSTHEGSGLSGFDRTLSSSCPDSTVLDGLAIRGNDCQNSRDSVQNTVNDWLTGLGF